MPKVPSVHIDYSHAKKNFENIANRLHLKTYEDWYGVSPSEVQKHGGFMELKHFRTLPRALKQLYPERKWDISKFAMVPPPGYWNNIDNQRALLDEVAAKLNIISPSDWYQVKQHTLGLQGAFGLMHKYKHDIFKMLSTVYPEVSWDSTKFRVHAWSDKSYQRTVMDEIGKQLSITSMEHWYRIKYQDVVKIPGGASLLNQYNSNLRTALQAIYPEYEFDVFKFSSVSRGFWDDVQNHRAFLDNVALSLSVNKLQDWCKITSRMLIAKGGEALLREYKGSMYKMLSNVYPEHHWDPLAFKKVHGKYWDEPHNQRYFLEELAKKLNVQSMRDWYKVTKENIIDNGGSALLKRHKDLHQLFKSTFPEYSWDTSQFRTPHSYWQDPANGQKFLDSIAKALNIKTALQWRQVSEAFIVSRGGRGLLHVNRGLHNLLKKYIPGYALVPHSQLGPQLKTQRLVLKYLQRLFPEHAHRTTENFRHPDMEYQVNHVRNIEFDIIIHNLSLAFEYQGRQHYFQSLHGGFADYQLRDAKKRQQCKLHGITLVEVPYWWKNDMESLIATIKQVRPDIPLPNVDVPPLPMSIPIKSSSNTPKS